MAAGVSNIQTGPAHSRAVGKVFTAGAGFPSVADSQSELADAGLLPSEQQIEQAYAEQPVIDDEAVEPPDFWHIEVLDKNGRAVKFGSVLRARATVVIVLRHFGCILCREIVPRLTRFRGFYASLGIPMIALGCGAPQHAKRFLKEGFFDGEIYVDQPRAVYEALRCKRMAKWDRRIQPLLADAKAHGVSGGPTMGDYFVMVRPVVAYRNLGWCVCDFQYL
jgi:hypothetical protein